MADDDYLSTEFPLEFCVKMIAMTIVSVVIDPVVYTGITTVKNPLDS